MKKSVKILFTALLAGILLWGCGTTPADQTDNTDGNDVIQTEVSTDAPELTPAKHDIALSEVKSMLAVNGLQTNINKYFASEAAVYHGGQQMRVVHTDRGIYTAFAKDSGDNSTGIQQFYVAKVDNDNQVSLLHYGEFTSDKNEILVNIAQDTNGDIIVTVTSRHELEVHVFDRTDDTMTKYSAVPVFTSGGTPSYAQSLFDFENRKIHAFYNGGLNTGSYLLEWFTFDMETMEWTAESIYTSIAGLGRHGYLYPLPDGNGGAYIVGQQNDSIQLAEDLIYDESNKYLWDELRLFHIPDLSSAENITYTTIQESYSERASEGIWSTAIHSSNGDVFMDSDGYLHITYMYYQLDMIGTHENFDPEIQYRHAIYNGMECIYNEEIPLLDSSSDRYDVYSNDYDVNIMQAANKTLYMIVIKHFTAPIQMAMYKASDSLGKTWELVQTFVLDTDSGLQSGTFSTSGIRDGSVQDNTVSCFFYYYHGLSDRTPYVFNLSLEDYTITEPIGILNDFDLRVDDRNDVRVPSSAHQTKILRTDNGVYAAFVYNYYGWSAEEYFHILKIDSEGNTSLLLSDSFASEQNKYLTMHEMPDGRIAVCPPTGNTIYTVDPVTDEVLLHKITDKRIAAVMTPQQVDVLADSVSGEMHYLSFSDPKRFSLSDTVLDTETMTLAKESIKYTFDKELTGGYSDFFILSDGKDGVYLVGTRYAGREELADTLTYVGHTNILRDGITVFHIPALSEEKEILCTEVVVPYDAEGSEGIRSVIDVADTGDVYLDTEGKLHILYTYHHFDFDDADRRGNPALVADTLKHYHAVFDGTALLSNEELGIDVPRADSFMRMTAADDGTPYLFIGTPEESGTRLDVYAETEDGWALTVSEVLGTFHAESFSIGALRNSVADCIVFADDNDVYYFNVTFTEKNG